MNNVGRPSAIKVEGAIQGEVDGSEASSKNVSPNQNS